MRITLLAALLLVALAGAACAGSIGSEYVNGTLTYLDMTTAERVQPVAPIYFYDDFVGACFQKYVANECTTARWKTIETSLGTAIALTSNSHDILLTLEATSRAERAVVYFGDQCSINAYYGASFEARVKFSVAQTLGTSTVIGFASADNADNDAIATNMWFKVPTGTPTKLVYEADDGTTDTDDQAATTISTTSWYVLRVDVTATQAKFFVDGVLVGTAAIAALTSTTGLVQPYIAVERSNGSGLGALRVDYVRVWAKRP